MAHAEKSFARSLDLLSHSVALAMRLGDHVGGNQGRVGVLRSRLQKAQSELDAHRRRQPYDKRLVARKADRVFGFLVEYLTVLVDESTEDV